jgi:hypothetical protein
MVAIRGKFSTLAPKSRVDGGAGNDVIDAGLVAFPLLLRVNDALYLSRGSVSGRRWADTITGTNASESSRAATKWYGEALPFDPAFPSRAAQLKRRRRPDRRAWWRRFRPGQFR